MKWLCNPACIVFCLSGFISVKAQQGTLLYSPSNRITAADSQLTKYWAPIVFKNANAPILKITKRKHDSPFFCNELTPYKNGYIINGLTTSPGAGDISTTYEYYFLQSSDNKLFKLAIPGLDTVESIISLHGNILAAGKMAGQPVLINSITGNISVTIGSYIIGKDSWIKLGVEGDIVYALDKHGLYRLDGASWQRIADFSIDEFYTQKLHYKRPATIVPTENIRVKGSKLYFLQEVLQGRTCYLFELDINDKNGLTEFWSSHAIKDNYSKQVNSYTITSDGNIFIAGERLMGHNLLLKEEKDGQLVMTVFNNILKDGDGNTEIKVRKVVPVANKQLLVAENGVFNMQENVIEPMVYFSNSSQEIKEHGETIHFDFYPRAVEVIDENKLLIGGMYGGLYLVDLSAKKITCLDDVDFGKVGKMTLTDIQ